MKLSKKLIILLDILALLLLIGLDQFTKDLAVRYLKNQPAVPIWQGVLELNYLENKGAAFGMLKNQKWFFIFIAIVILGIICYILWKTPNQKKYITLHALLTLIAAGAIGRQDPFRLRGGLYIFQIDQLPDFQCGGYLCYLLYHCDRHSAFVCI